MYFPVLLKIFFPLLNQNEISVSIDSTFLSDSEQSSFFFIYSLYLVYDGKRILGSQTRFTLNFTY